MNNARKSTSEQCTHEGCDVIFGRLWPTSRICAMCKNPVCSDHFFKLESRELQRRFNETLPVDADGNASSGVCYACDAGRPNEDRESTEGGFELGGFVVFWRNDNNTLDRYRIEGQCHNEPDSIASYCVLAPCDPTRMTEGYGFVKGGTYTMEFLAAVDLDDALVSRIKATALTAGGERCFRQDGLLNWDPCDVQARVDFVRSPPQDAIAWTTHLLSAFWDALCESDLENRLRKAKEEAKVVPQSRARKLTTAWRRVLKTLRKATDRSTTNEDPGSIRAWLDEGEKTLRDNLARARRHAESLQPADLSARAVAVIDLSRALLAHESILDHDLSKRGAAGRQEWEVYFRLALFGWRGLPWAFLLGAAWRLVSGTELRHAASFHPPQSLWRQVLDATADVRDADTVNQVFAECDFGRQWEVGGLIGRGSHKEVHKLKPRVKDHGHSAVPVLCRLRGDRFDMAARQAHKREEEALVAVTQHWPHGFGLSDRVLPLLHWTGVFKQGDVEVPALAVDEVVGDTLQHRLNRIEREPLTLDEKLRISGSLARAVELLSMARVIHGDIKPANIMINTEASSAAVLIDFSCAAMVGGDGNAVRPAGGSEGYIAPEWRVGAPVTGPAERGRSDGDVYALGCVLRQLFADSRSPVDTNAEVQLEQVDDEEVRQLLIKIVGQCLEHVPASRPEPRCLREDLVHAGRVLEREAPPTRLRMIEDDVDKQIARWLGGRAMTSSGHLGALHYALMLDALAERFPTESARAAAIVALHDVAKAVVRNSVLKKWRDRMDPGERAHLIAKLRNELKSAVGPRRGAVQGWTEFLQTGDADISLGQFEMALRKHVSCTDSLQTYLRQHVQGFLEQVSRVRELATIRNLVTHSVTEKNIVLVGREPLSRYHNAPKLRLGHTLKIDAPGLAAYKEATRNVVHSLGDS